MTTVTTKTSQKKQKTSVLANIRLFLLLSFPVVLFCSYFPIIPIVSTASTNYELSLPLIWLLIFSILSLKDFAKHLYSIFTRWKNQKSFRAVAPLLFYLFPLYLIANIIWSANPVRSLMTTGIVWCLIITNVTAYSTLKNSKETLSKLLKVFLGTAVIFCILCWVQSILDVVGVGREITLLCSGCTSYSFGFPHPSGLAIEPQFMGNLLLAPTLVALYLFAITTNKTNRTKSQIIKQGKVNNNITMCIKPHTTALLSFFFSATLFLTFSRGAIYSFCIAFAVLFIYEIAKKNHQFWRSIPLLLLSFIFTLLAQGLFSAVSYTDSTFTSGIEKSISQLSLGQINLELSPATDQSSSESPSESSPSPVFDGYVEESTNTRMRFNQISIELAPKNPLFFIFGYGLGSAGEVMYQNGYTSSRSEIIQNEYLSLLLEVGIVGILLAILSLVSLAIVLSKTIFLHPLILSLLLAYAFSLLFFSGLPNALHIYLSPVILLMGLRLSRPLRSH